PVQWQVFLAEHVYGGGQILLRPVQIAHLEALQLPRAGFAGTTEVDGRDVETATGSMFGETSIEALGYPGTAGHQEVAPGAARRMIAIDAQRIAVACEQGELFRADADGGGRCGHDELRTAVSCWNQGGGMSAGRRGRVANFKRPFGTLPNGRTTVNRRRISAAPAMTIRANIIPLKAAVIEASEADRGYNRPSNLIGPFSPELDDAAESEVPGTGAARHRGRSEPVHVRAAVLYPQRVLPAHHRPGAHQCHQPGTDDGPQHHRRRPGNRAGGRGAAVLP